MNRLTIIGNLTRDPETRTTSTGKTVTTFSVAVNSKKKDEEAIFFRVNAWDKLGELCQKWLVKGRKVCVVGSVSLNSYTGNDGRQYNNLEVLANEVEFLSSASEAAGRAAENSKAAADKYAGYEEVSDGELPF